MGLVDALEKLGYMVAVLIGAGLAVRGGLLAAAGVLGLVEDRDPVFLVFTGLGSLAVYIGYRDSPLGHNQLPRG